MYPTKPEPSTLIIFGATGDLAKKKLLPALYRLLSLKLLPDVFNIIGMATRALSDDEYRNFAKVEIVKNSRVQPVDNAKLDKLLSRTWFISSPFDNRAGYEKLASRLVDIDKTSGVKCGRLFYLATPPSFFVPIIEVLAQTGLSRKDAEQEQKAKIVIEKPFGRDKTSATELNKLILKNFDEEEVYRIDHYLGKETVQNILYFRFANGIYEPIWNRRYIDHVQITAAESIGVEGRGKYFEEAGTLRDMVQNHILQLLSLVAMEPPISMDAEVIRGKKYELLKSMRPIEPHETPLYTVRGQYGAGNIEGVNVPGYREEEGVGKESETETYVALKAQIDNWRWAGVPFYLRTGKRMKQNLTEIALHFKEVPHCLFTKNIATCPERNVLTLKIQPDEGIAFQFNVKRPGSANYMETVKMDFSYKDSFKTELPEAYERLILDCMLGDSTLFPHKEGIEASWEFITKILGGWANQPPPRFPNYSAGTWGPQEADALMAQGGRVWKNQ